jgi:hypothetical protein
MLKFKNVQMFGKITLKHSIVLILFMIVIILPVFMYLKRINKHVPGRWQVDNIFFHGINITDSLKRDEMPLLVINSFMTCELPNFQGTISSFAEGRWKHAIKGQDSLLIIQTKHTFFNDTFKYEANYKN